jgi:hypothetical protein
MARFGGDTVKTYSVTLISVILRLPNDTQKFDALHKKSKYHQRQLVDGSDPTYGGEREVHKIPPTGVGGLFRSGLFSILNEAFALPYCGL